MLEIFKVGDLVRQGQVWQHHSNPVGVVVRIFHEASANEGLQVKMMNGDTLVAPSEDWSKV